MYRSGELKGDFVIHKTRANSGPQNIAQWPVKMKAYGGYEYWFITGHIQWIMQMKTQLAMKDRELDPKKFNSWLKTRKVADSKIHQLRKSSADEFSRFMTRVDYVRILKELFEPDEWTDYIVDTEMPRFGVLLYRNGKSYATFMGDYQTQHNINVNGNRKLDKFPTYLRKRAPKLDVNHPKNMGLFDYWSAPITIEWEDSSED